MSFVLNWSFILNCLLISLGGVVGALLRYLSTYLLSSLSLLNYAISIFICNLLGSFVAGFAYVIVTKTHNFTLSLFLIVGVLGSFTTFSAYSIETVKLLHNSPNLYALPLYILSNSLLCPLAALLSMYLANKLL